MAPHVQWKGPSPECNALSTAMVRDWLCQVAGEYSGLAGVHLADLADLQLEALHGAAGTCPNGFLTPQHPELLPQLHAPALHTAASDDHLLAQVLLLGGEELQDLGLAHNHLLLDLWRHACHYSGHLHFTSVSRLSDGSQSMAGMLTQNRRALLCSARCMLKQNWSSVSICGADRCTDFQ